MLAVLEGYSEMPTTQNILRTCALTICQRDDVPVQETEPLDVLSSRLASDEYLRKRCTGGPHCSLSTSSRWFTNMQTDGRVCCQKTELFKSCGTFRVLVGVTGSVASLKLPPLVSQLLQLPGVSCSLFIYFYSYVCLCYLYTKCNVLMPLHLYTLVLLSLAERVRTRLNRKREL